MKKTSIAALLVLCLLSLPAMAATPPLGATQTLSPVAHSIYQPVVAMDADGRATALWSYASSSRRGMRFADRAPGEGFAPGYSLTTPESNQVAWPAIDKSDNGTTAAVWVDEIDDIVVVMVTYRTGTGPWSAPEAVATGASDQDSYSYPHVAVSDSGRIAVVFWHYLEDGSHNVETVLGDTAGAFGAPQVMHNRIGSESVGNFGPNVGIDAAGNAMILWESYDDAETDPRTFVMYALASSTEDTFAAPVTLSEVHQDGVDPRVAVNPSGKAVAIWIQTQEFAESYLNSATGTTTTGLTTLGLVPGGRPDWIDLALDEDGNAIAARRGLVDITEEIQASVLEAGSSTWGSSQTLDSGTDTDTSLETNDDTLDVAAVDGTGIVAWARQDPSGYLPARIAVLDAATGTFEPKVMVSSPAADIDRLRVDMNVAGDVVLVWRDGIRAYARGTWDPPAAGSLSMNVNRGQRITVSGKLSPSDPGAKMSVTLYRKSSGTFRRIASKTVTLDASSKYSASFSRPRPGTCRAKAVFAGDGLVQPDRVKKTFDC